MKTLKKIKNKIGLVVISISLFIMNAEVAYASGLKDSKLVTGTEKLFKDATASLMIISPVTTVALLIWQFIKLQSAEDEGEMKPIRKRMKMIAILGIGVFLVATMLNVILGYYTDSSNKFNQ